MSHDHQHAHDALFGFRVFCGKPRLHQDSGDEQVHRQVTWTELFFDLFYVVACINLGHLVSKDDVWTGVSHLILYYLLFWYTWNAHTIFTTRFKVPGLLYDVWQIVYMLGVFSMVITSKSVTYHQHFSVALTVVKFLLATAYVFVAFTIPRAYTLGMVLAAEHATAGVLALISVFTSVKVFYGLMAAAIAVDVFWVQIQLRLPRSIHVPLHVDHMAERYGLIMIIFLGESIVSLGLQSPGQEWENWLMLLFGVVVVWDLHLIYYHIHPGQDVHALRTNRFRGASWSFMHAVLGFFFLCLGAGLRLTAETYAAAKGGGGGEHRRSLLGGGEESVTAKGAGAYSSVGEADHGPAGGDYKAAKHDGVILNSDVAWLLCLGYSLSLHAFYCIRALHFMDFDTAQWWNTSLAEHNLTWISYVWWAFGFLWPFPVYFTAFAYDNLHGAWVLAILAVHGFLFIVVETMFTNLIVKHEQLQVSLRKQLHKVASEGSQKRRERQLAASMGSGSLGAESGNRTATESVDELPVVKASNATALTAV